MICNKISRQAICKERIVFCTSSRKNIRVKKLEIPPSSRCSSEWTRCVFLNLYGTLPWGWICVYRPCPSDWSSCAGRTGSSDDAEDVAPCFHDRGYRPRSLCSSDDPRWCCSSGPPPADFYTHAHHATCTPFCVHASWSLICTHLWRHRGHTHVQHVLQRTSLLIF